MILVTGATGTIGDAVVRQLAARGERTRALTRDPARADLPPGVEVVRGDYADPGSLTAASAGVSAVFLVTPPGPDAARYDTALVSAARAAGEALRHRHR
ncbi:MULTISPECIES: SDR family oxidoreductase [Streptomyces]|uniref:SDR family oxidoreductase n=1 Tax=Streptomyces TaxID=1883 RepID=UPI0027DE9ECE|nr:NmrA family NAD(P)-binding protein [Streptomyces sp. CRPSP2-6A1]